MCLTIGAPQSCRVAEVSKLRGDVADINGQLSLATSMEYVADVVMQAKHGLTDL